MVTFQPDLSPSQQLIELVPVLEKVIYPFKLLVCASDFPSCSKADGVVDSRHARNVSAVSSTSPP